MDLSRSTTTLAAIALAVIFAVPAVRHWRERPAVPPDPPQPIRSAWIAANDLEVGGGGDYMFGLSLAPDGRRLVYPAARSGVVSLWLHDLRNGETREVPGTAGAAMPFWSSDGSKIGYFASAHVRVVDLATGQTSDLADATQGRGASWNQQGDLVFAPAAQAGLMRRGASGSTATFTTLDAANGETAHSWPTFLPDGRHVIFLVTAAQASRSGIWIASLDDPASRKRLIASDTAAIVVDRTLLYLRDQVLVAQPIDADKGELTGRAEAVALNVGHGPIAQLFASASGDVLITGAPGSTMRELRWVAKDGQPIGSPSEPLDAWDLRIAPDGKRVAITEIDRQLRTLDVFVRTGAQPAPARLSLSTDVDESPVWSPDGLRIAWAGQRRKVMIRGAGAVLPEQTIATFDVPIQVWDWSRDGKALLIGKKSADTGDDLWIQPPAEGAAAQPYWTKPFDQAFGVIAPDGRAIAYASNESGQFDIYVDAFPKPGTRTRVTTAGGTEPRWSNDGRELFFRRGSEIHAVSIEGFEVTIDREAVRCRRSNSRLRRQPRWTLPVESACRHSRTHRSDARHELVRLRGDATARQEMKIATWNVNGVRARQGQLLEWLAAEKPDVVCLQEIKASLDQLTFELRDIEGYWSYWHGDKGYSGVGLLISKALTGALPACSHPTFDFEQRIVCATLPSAAGDIRIASVYVPNGGKDFAAKMRFLADLDNFVLEAARDQKQVIICGDLNVAIAERDIHPKLRKPNQIGARPEERALMEQMLSHGLVDVHRRFEPDNDNLFTWWAPWRQQKERNIGWRIDYVLASKAIAERATSAVVQREIGSSDHGPVVVSFDFS